MKSITVVLALSLGLASFATAQNVNAKPDATASINVASTTATVPEYTNVIYARTTDGSLSALPRAGVKGTKVLFPADAPVISGPLVVKLEGSSDPQSILEVGTGGKGFNKPVAFTAKTLGNRVFELVIVAPEKGGDCVLAFKVSGLALPTDLFAFRTGGAK